MVKDIKMSFKTSYKSNLWCEWCDCGVEESRCQVTVCSGWEDERRGLDLCRMEDLITFFQRILIEKVEKRKEGLL